jgi:hypothetical protein
VPKDPVTSGNAENGVFAYVQACAARSGRMSRLVDYSWTGSWGIVPGQPQGFRSAPQPASGHSSGAGGGSGSFCRSARRAFSPLRVVNHGHRSGRGCAGQARRCSIRHRWN